jgi:hypothetical protein
MPAHVIYPGSPVQRDGIGGPWLKKISREGLPKAFANSPLFLDREVKKHSRELLSSTNKMNDLDKIDHLTKKCNELFTSMKRLERESAKNKKRADQVQKEKDASRNEASKQTGLKEKLEKLCRELQKDNNKLKNDHRSLQDQHTKLKKDGDRRTEEIFKTLEGYQEEKDNPRKPVLNGKVEDLYARSRPKPFMKVLAQMLTLGIGLSYDSSPSSTNMSYAICISIRKCVLRKSKYSITWHATTSRRKPPRPRPGNLVSSTPR